MNLSLLLSAIYAFPVIVTGQFVGSQNDEHNCVTDGGYHWCQATESCIRPWITPCHNIAVDPMPPRPVPSHVPSHVPSKTEFCKQSQLQLCRMRCSLPNCPGGQCAMRSGSCCDYVCHSAVQHRRTQGVPHNCASWYDGCNTCSVDTSGKVGTCTMMMCFAPGTAECMSYHVVNDAIPLNGIPDNLNPGDICFRFCEDSSESYIDRQNDCVSGTRCRGPNTGSTSMISYDSCHDRHWTCQQDTNGH